VRGLTLILLAAFIAVVSGCQESGFDERRETAKPLKVQHALGEAKVPGQAERPMTLTTDALDDTLALGVRPVRAALPGGRLPAYLRSRARGVEVVPAVTALDLAAIDAAKPDLILGSAAAQKGLYNDLRQIAPTVMTEKGGVQWKLNTRLHGEALGRTNDAEQLLIDYDRRSARVRRRLGKRVADTEVSVVLVTPRDVRMAGRESFPGSVLGDLGLSRPRAQEGSREYETVSPDQVPALDGDVMLLSVAPGAGEALRRLEARPAWRRLRVVRPGRVVRVDAATWWSGGGVLAARAAMRDVERAFDRR
jgi:ABC-type Fe3+-hydroxamate transport system substrate-binding protein